MAAQLPRGPVAHVLALEPHLALGFDQPHQGQRQRGLARPAFAHDAQGFTPTHLDISLVHGLHMAHRPLQQPLLDREPDAQPMRLDQRLGAFRHRIGHTRRRGAQQLFRVIMLRIAENLLGGTGLDDLAILHHADPVGNPPHHAQIMGDEEKSHVLLALQLRQQLQNLRLDRHVQRRRRLVRDQDIGLVRQRHGDHHPLPLAARQLVRISAQPAFGVADAHAVQQFQNAVPHRRTAQPLVQLDRLGQLLFQRVQRVQAGHRLLEDEADVVAPHLAQQLVIRADHLLAVIGDAALDKGAFPQQRNGAQRRHRLARAAFTHQCHGLAPVYAERHAAHSLRHCPILAETHLQIFDFKQAH